jgi:hypothetical protein
MNRKPWSLVRIATLSALALLPAGLRADTQLTLSSVSGSAGEDVTVYGTISHTGAGTTNLNAEDFTLGSSHFAEGKVTDFFNNAPFFLTGDSDSGLIALFSFAIAPGTAGGIYAGNSLEILGGPGIFDQNILAGANFSVDVTSGTVPEPGTLALLFLALGIALVAASKWRWRPRFPAIV